MSINNLDQIRRKLATVQIMLLSERDRCAKKAGQVQTGQLATDQGKWEHESLLREMILYQQSADIVEAIVKGLI